MGSDYTDGIRLHLSITTEIRITRLGCGRITLYRPHIKIATKIDLALSNLCVYGMSRGLENDT